MHQLKGRVPPEELRGDVNHEQPREQEVRPIVEGQLEPMLRRLIIENRNVLPDVDLAEVFDVEAAPPSRPSPM